ncbi:MAG: hypothetical protein MUC62_04480 [Candidatus Thermoplasmatota archaeon]|jgi:hypothetical protein|nr:hypothetical protein [Candidatus Thermoplasmatota archaeon]
MKSLGWFLIIGILISFLMIQNNANSIKVNNLPSDMSGTSRHPIVINITDIYIINENNLSGFLDWGDGTHLFFNSSEIQNNQTIYTHYYEKIGIYIITIKIYQNQREEICEDNIHVRYYRIYPPEPKPSHDIWYVFIHFPIILILLIISLIINFKMNE